MAFLHLWPNGWMDQDATRCPGHIVLDGDPVGTKPPQQSLPHFRPMSIVAKRSPISATAELLSLIFKLPRDHSYRVSKK